MNRIVAFGKFQIQEQTDENQVVPNVAESLNKVFITVAKMDKICGL